MSQNVYINSISKYKTFVYDRVETNAGSGYDVNSGKFTAPERGLYVFHTSTTAYDRSYSTIEVVKNGQVKDITIADAMDHDDRAVASTMTILSLIKGDIVFVRVGVALRDIHVLYVTLIRLCKCIFVFTVHFTILHHLKQ